MFLFDIFEFSLLNVIFPILYSPAFSLFVLVNALILANNSFLLNGLVK